MAANSRNSVSALSVDGFSLVAFMQEGLVMSEPTAIPASVMNATLSNASFDRLVSLLRHWTWADEAMERFDREADGGWENDDDPISDRPFGAYYHWCALLCALVEAALDQSLLSSLQLDTIREDVEVSLQVLRASRQLLTVIPNSIEDKPRLLTLLDDHNLSRLRRIHLLLGETLRQEQVSREVDSLDP